MVEHARAEKDFALSDEIRDALIARGKSEAAKEALRRRVDEARHLGLFGAPTFLVDGEMFWGNDRIEDALDWVVRGTLRPNTQN